MGKKHIYLFSIVLLLISTSLIVMQYLVVDSTRYETPLLETTIEVEYTSHSDITIEEQPESTESTTRHLNHYNSQSMKDINLAYEFEEQAQLGKLFLMRYHATNGTLPSVENLTKYTDVEIAKVFLEQMKTIREQGEDRVIESILFEIKQESPLMIRYTLETLDNGEPLTVYYDLTFNIKNQKIMSLERVNH